MTNKQYYPWIDWAKAIGIFLVVLGHSAISKSSFTLNLIYSFHMPLFFIISGILNKQISLKETITKNFFTLLVPYLIINVICLGYLVLQDIYHHIFLFKSLGGQIIAILLGINSCGDFVRPACYYTWFIIALFYCKLLGVFLFKHPHYQLIGSIACGCVGFYLAQSGIDTYVPIDSALLAFPFYSLGYYLSKRTTVFEDKKHLFIKILIFALLTCLGILFVSQNGFVDINFQKYGNNVLVFYLAATLLSLSFLFWCSLLPAPTNIIRNISRGTILILGLHHFILRSFLLRIAYILFPDYMLSSTSLNVVLSLLTILLFIPIITLCKNHFPFILGYRNYNYIDNKQQ